MVYLSDIIIIIIIMTELSIIWYCYDDDDEGIMAHFTSLYIAWSIVILDSTLLVPVQSVWKEDFFSVVTTVVVIVIVSVTIIKEAIT